jgi:VanZ family protein
MFRKLLESVWPSLIWTVLIFILLTLPFSNFPSKGIFSLPHFDKFVHIILFGAFTWLWSTWWARRGRTEKINLKGFFIIFLASSLYGTGMEFYQEHFTGRDFDFYDIVADITGSAIAWSIVARKYKSPYGNRGR